MYTGSLDWDVIMDTLDCPKLGKKALYRNKNECLPESFCFLPERKVMIVNLVLYGSVASIFFKKRKKKNIFLVGQSFINFSSIMSFNDFFSRIFNPF